MDMMWKDVIKASLRERNTSEIDPFERLIQQNATLISHIVSTGKVDNLIHPDDGRGDQEVQHLREKVFKLQDELTQVHRDRSVNAQTVIDLSKQTKHLEDVNDGKDAIISKVESEIVSLKSEIEKEKKIFMDLNSRHQLLLDEYQAIQLTLSSTESKLVESQKMVERLLSDVMQLKTRDVEKLNSANDLFLKNKQENVKQMLRDASDINEDDNSALRNNSQMTLDSTPRLGKSSHPGQLPNLNMKLHHHHHPHPPPPPLSKPRVMHSIKSHDSEINAIISVPPSHMQSSIARLVSGGSDRKVKVWSVHYPTDVGNDQQFCANINLVTTLSGCNGSVTCLDYLDSCGIREVAGGGGLLLAGSTDFACRVWSLDTTSLYRLRQTLTGHSSKVLTCKFMSNCSSPNHIISGSQDRTLKVWDLKSRACVSTLFPGSTVICIQVEPNSIISGHFDKKIRFYDVRSVAGTGGGPTNSTQREPVQTIDTEGRVTHIDIRNMKIIVATRSEDSVNLYDLRSLNKPVASFQSPSLRLAYDYAKVKISSDGGHAICGGLPNGHLILWDLDNPSKEGILLSPPSNDTNRPKSSGGMDFTDDDYSNVVTDMSWISTGSGGSLVSSHYNGEPSSTQSTMFVTSDKSKFLKLWASS